MKHGALNVVLLLVLAANVGCSHDLSTAEAYRDLIGREVTLVDDMEFHSTGKSTPASLSTPHHRGSTPVPDILAAAPAGTRLRIAAVRSHWSLTTWVIVAYGTTAGPGASNELEWGYQWGNFNGDNSGQLCRAPWEDPQVVPESRQLRNKGRVIATQASAAASQPDEMQIRVRWDEDSPDRPLPTPEQIEAMSLDETDHTLRYLYGRRLRARDENDGEMVERLSRLIVSAQRRMMELRRETDW